GAVILRNNFRDRSRTRIVVRETDRIIRPGERFQRLPALNKGERARFWNNNEFRAAQGARPVLNFNDQSVQQRRYIRTKGDATKFEQQKQIEQRRIESKQIEQQKDLQQQSLQQKNIEQRKRSEDARRQQKSIEQKNIQDRNLQQQQRTSPQRDQQQK